MLVHDSNTHQLQFVPMQANAATEGAISERGAKTGCGNGGLFTGLDAHIGAAVGAATNLAEFHSCVMPKVGKGV